MCKKLLLIAVVGFLVLNVLIVVALQTETQTNKAMLVQATENDARVQDVDIGQAINVVSLDEVARTILLDADADFDIGAAQSQILLARVAQIWQESSNKVEMTKSDLLTLAEPYIAQIKVWQNVEKMAKIPTNWCMAETANIEIAKMKAKAAIHEIELIAGTNSWMTASYEKTRAAPSLSDNNTCAVENPCNDAALRLCA